MPRASLFTGNARESTIYGELDYEMREIGTASNPDLHSFEIES